LIKALGYDKDKHSSLLKNADRALKKIAGPHAEEPLIAALKEKNLYMRDYAAYIFGRIRMVT
jgi:HEAT repeat protein